MITHFCRLACLFLSCVVAASSCSKQAPRTPPENHGAPPENRIDVPESVRKNLGITFAKTQRRRVATTLRLPGNFEATSQARAEHRAPLAGRIELRVVLRQPIKKGDILFALDAPDWRSSQRQLDEIDTELGVAAAHLAAIEPLLAAHRNHEDSLHQALAVMQARVQSLQETQQSLGGQAQALSDARVQVAQVQAQIAEAAEKHTETTARIARLQADQRALAQRRTLSLAAAAATLGTTPQALLATTDQGPRWRTLDRIEVRASADGFVESLPMATGSFVDAHERVATTLDPSSVHFRARALQGDLGRLREGMPAVLTPPGAVDPSARASGVLQLGLAADPTQRTLDVFVIPATSHPFVRPGVAGFVEIATDGSAAEVLSIPRAAVLQDGLVHVFFRRDPKNRDRVIRVEADLGTDDGRWVEVKSGLVDGDEVVLTGAYELVLASANTAQKGGHFHADGTWHADDHK